MPSGNNYLYRLDSLWLIAPATNKSGRRSGHQDRRKHVQNKKRFFGIVVAVLLVGCAALGNFLVPGHAAASGRTSLPGSVPSWANAKNYAGQADANTDIGFRVYLAWNNPSAVESLAGAVSDPHTSSYGQYLTAAQFRQQFAPSQAQVGAVQSWLHSQSFSVEYTPQNNHYISAEVNIVQAETAFSTSCSIYM